uniref:Keratin type i cytoskeletal 10-like protein n=1 Tax=Triatoma infestans TaxID=30076 RepID=A0A170ZSK6_TRIIF
MRLTFIILLSAVYSCLAGPVYPQQELPKAQKLYITDDMKMAMVKDLQNEVVKVAVLKTLADSIKLEQAAEDKILEAAVETLEEEPSPERTEKLKEVEQLLKRDKRAVQILNGLLGGSSGGGGGGADASAGSDSGAILNLIGPLLGSSSGGAGGSSGGDASGGSGLESILSLSSSSKGGGATAGGGVAVEAGAHGDSVLGQVKGAKFALVSDKIQLLMRVKFGLLSKILTTITNKIAQVSIPPHEQSIDNLKYPS